MRDAVDEYKMAIKKIDTNFDGDYYDRLFFGEPLIPTPDDPIKTPWDAAEQDVAPSAEPKIGSPTKQG